MARQFYSQFDKYSSAEATNPSRLWLLRMLVPLALHRVFIKNEHFDNEFLAEMLGFGRWIDPPDGEFNAQRIRADLRRIYAQAEKDAARVELPRVLARNLDRLTRLIALTDVDREILAFVTLLKSDRLLDDTADGLGMLSSAKVHQVLAVLLNRPEAEIRHALSLNGTLGRTGLVTLERRGTNTLTSKIELLDEGLPDHLLSSDDDNLVSLLRDVVTQAPTPQLGLGDFEHMSRTLEILRPYLARALDTQRRGVNIFVHGSPGTGKTQLARVLAKELSCELLEVTGQDEDGDAVNGERRLRTYRFAQSFFANRRTLLVFDEAEDVFNDGDSLFGRRSVAQTRKAWINNALEDNAVPTLWLSNSVRGLDPAFVRRFDMLFELPVPSKRYRQRIVSDSCKDLLSADAKSRIADCECLAPAVITRAVSVVEAIADQLPTARVPEALEYLIGNTLIAQGHPPLSKPGAVVLPDTYNPEFIQSDVDLGAVAEGIARSRNARLCLYGPPGTGKSAYGHWLAERLDVPLHQKRASDLISKWVGGTEKNIARAFRQAEEEGALLLLDEVDSFLQDRRDARQSWEITEVNEMLTQMEHYNGVMIATTNLVKELDQAALRRFDFKVKFDFLRPKQAVELFRRYCAKWTLSAPRLEQFSRLMRLKNLTPGDFAAVARQQRLRPLRSAAELTDALAAECALKEGSRAAIGFIQ